MTVDFQFDGMRAVLEFDVVGIPRTGGLIGAITVRDAGGSSSEGLVECSIPREGGATEDDYLFIG